MKHFIAIALLASLTTSELAAQEKSKEVYELRVYELTMGSLSHMESYFTKALIPALNRQGVKNVGVFREIGKSEPAKMYVLIPHASMTEYGKSREALRKDSQYQTASEAYNQLASPVYGRYETSLMVAFEGLPSMIVPDNSERIFELRTYQGYSDDAVRRKIRMFNEGELDIFYRTKLNPVYFGEMISGKDLPCLQYMITFRNMEERDTNWKAFSADPDWARMSKDPQYANTVSKILRVFLEPLPYSQI
jgi:hypothetical protein